jgi:predicted nucleic acid-binding protein
MTDLFFVDTNILVYAMDPGDPGKRDRASALLKAGADGGWLVTSPQSLNECYRVLTGARKAIPQSAARDFIRTFQWTCRAPMDWQTIVKAWDIADTRSYNWWDCLLLASATQVACALFLTEDLHHGDDIDGMMIVNPFVADLSPLLF